MTPVNSDASAPASVADGVDHQLDPRAIALHRLTGWIFCIWLAGASFIFLAVVWFTRGRTLVALAAMALMWLAGNGTLAWHLQRWPAITHRYTSYRVDQQGIEIRRGVVWRRVINVPRSRVQHTDVSQGPLERRYGLGTLIVHTAGTDYARVTLSGLAHPTALRIREHLLPTGQSDAV
jgi:membrane protein YdbS with pleckstrin-like domain